MKKKIKGFAFIMAASVLPLMYMSGCSSISYGNTKEEEVVEYAVNAVLNHDKNYIVKLADRAPEPETTTVWISDNEAQNAAGSESQEGNAGNNNSSGGNSEKPQTVTVSANEGFGLSGFTVTEAGYELSDRYPDGNDGFSMVALKNNKLLVLKFNVTNNSGSAASLDMLGKNLSYRCLINNSKGVNVQVTALLNALNTYNGTFEAGETKEMVLVFQISDEISANINNISLYIAKDSGTGVIAIK